MSLLMKIGHLQETTTFAAAEVSTRLLAVVRHRQKGIELCADQTRLHAHKDYRRFISPVPILLFDGREHKLKTFMEYARTHAQRTDLH